METGKKEVFAAVVLAAGRGKRMESSVHKQYLLLHEKPGLYYALINSVLFLLIFMYNKYNSC